MSEFALSTSWNAKTSKDARGLITEIKEAGFESVELNFTLTEDVVKDIRSMASDGFIDVISLHNFCPMPKGVNPADASPDYYSLASLDDGEREKAIFFTKKTIEEAQELNAKAVILHCGRVKAKDESKELMRLCSEGLKESADFKSIKERILLQRNACGKPHLEKALASLNELARFASGRNILLGVENRCYFMEIPSFEEIDEIIKRFGGSCVCYWHDTGHAQIFQELGFGTHRDYLDRYGRHMRGVHLHDIRGVHDHMAPGKGDFDFSILAPYMKKQIIKIIEAHQPATAEDIRYSKEYLKRFF